MTLKLTLDLTAGKTAIAYVNDNARILVGNDIIAAADAKSISVLNHVRTGADNMLRAMNNLIVNIKSIEKVDNIVVGYIDPEKITDISMPVIGIFIPKSSSFEKENEETGYKMYFAMINECD